MFGIPIAMIKSAQGGVLPKWLQGSRFTKSVHSFNIDLFVTFEWHQPLHGMHQLFVPSFSNYLIIFTITQPTKGFG